MNYFSSSSRYLRAWISLFSSLDFVIFEFGFRYSRAWILRHRKAEIVSCAYKVKHFPRHNRLFFSVFFHFPAFSCPPRPLRTNSSPLAYKSTAPCVQIHSPLRTNPSPRTSFFFARGLQIPRPELTKPSSRTYKFLARGIQIPRPGHTKPSPRTYKLLAPRIKTFSVARKYISKAWKYILKLLKYISKPLK